MRWFTKKVRSVLFFFFFFIKSYFVLSAYNIALILFIARISFRFLRY